MVTRVVAGNQADDGLYLPAIAATREGLRQTGMLYVGDSKMEALVTRATLAQAGDYYLVPLSQKGEQGRLLAEQVTSVLADEAVELLPVYPLGEVAGEEAKVLAQGWETVRPQEATLADGLYQWDERLLLIYSPTLAQSGYRGLAQRLQQAEAKLLALTPAPGRGKRQVTDRHQLETAVEAILSQHRVADYLQVAYQQQVEERHVRR